MKNSLKTTSFDPAKYLDTDEAIAAFLTDAFESGSDGVFQDALKTAARARGMAEVARTAGLGRESLYKALQADAQPRFATVRKVMTALGLQLAVLPAKGPRTGKTTRAPAAHPPGVAMARALSSRDRARRTGRYIAADVVQAEIEAKLDKAKNRKR